MSTPVVTPSPLSNRLLSRLPSAVLERLRPDLHLVALKPRAVLYKFRAKIDAVYFPASGIVSAMTVMEDGAAIEVATIGNEGMAGLTAFVGGQSSPNEVVVQLPGDGFRLPTEVLRREVGRNEALHDILVKYHTAYSTQVSYSVACNGLHKIEQRCSRWLLMTADRVGSNVIELTHEFLAVMLGVRRSSVTEVLRPLQDVGLIRNRRGMIEILDRSGLEARACECYRMTNAEFARQFD